MHVSVYMVGTGLCVYMLIVASAVCVFASVCLVGVYLYVYAL